MNFHQHTNPGGEVLILRRIPQSRISNGNGIAKDFVWPVGVGSVVTAPDWEPTNKCGHGLHGWPYGFGLGEGCDYDIINDVWLVIGVKPEDIIGELEGGAKCKFRAGTIRLEGKFGDAMHAVQSGFDSCVAAMAKESGDSSKAASSGNYSNAASSGYSSKAASSGNYSNAASSGNSCSCEATGGNNVVAIAGTGRVRVGLRGAFAVAYYTDSDGWRFLTGKVGEDGIEADTWYIAKDGKLTKE